MRKPARDRQIVKKNGTKEACIAKAGASEETSAGDKTAVDKTADDKTADKSTIDSPTKQSVTQEKLSSLMDLFAHSS